MIQTRMQTLWNDLRYAGRIMRRRPGFTAAIVLMTALGIGSATTIFSAINAIVIRPLPFRDPDRLVQIWATDRRQSNPFQIVSPADYVDWRDHSRSFESMAAWRFEYFNLNARIGAAFEPERVEGLRVSADFFRLLGASPALGRGFSAEEEQPGRDRVVILSDALWRRRFDADLSIVGRAILVEGEPRTVVGVLPPDFHFFRVLNRDLEVWVPYVFDPGTADRGHHAGFVYARLKLGVSLEAARSEMDAISERLAKEHPDTNAGWGALVNRLHDQWMMQSRNLLLLLLAATGFILLIACANVANLLLARGVARSREMAVRAAIGAGRFDLARQSLAESLLLALLGGAAGLLVALWGVRLFPRYVPYTAVNRWTDLRVDPGVFGFALAISIVSGVLFGLAPAFNEARPTAMKSLSETFKSSAGGRYPGRVDLRRTLVALEVALSLMLLAGAGLLLSAALHLRGMARGFEPANVLTMQVWLPRARYSEGWRVTEFFRTVLERVSGLTGVTSAAAVNFPPLAIQSTTTNFTVEGQEAPRPGEEPTAIYWVVSPDYFRTMRIPLLQGRAFTEQDGAQNEPGRIIVSESLARRYFQGAALGRRIQPRFAQADAFWLPQSTNAPLTIVGVVGDIREEGLYTREMPEIYLPYRQNPSSVMNMLVRTSADPMRWAAGVRAQVSGVDPDEPVFDVKTMDDVLSESFSRPRISADLLAGFAAAALLLAALGVYSVAAFAVSLRTREIGIRKALGAADAEIAALIVRQSLQTVLIGAAVGLSGAAFSARLLGSVFSGVTAVRSNLDIVLFGASTIVLIAIGALASYLPARRASRVDPLQALRWE
jgi:putative ABC transport system permease protein